MGVSGVWIGGVNMGARNAEGEKLTPVRFRFVCAFARLRRGSWNSRLSTRNSRRCLMISPASMNAGLWGPSGVIDVR